MFLSSGTDSSVIKPLIASDPIITDSKHPSYLSASTSIARLPASHKGVSSLDIEAVASYTFNSIAVSVHLIGNSLIFSFLNSTDEAAGSLISSIQNVITAGLGGILMSTGTQLGIALGEKDSITTTKIILSNKDTMAEVDLVLNDNVGAIIKTSWITGWILGGISTVFFFVNTTNYATYCCT